MTSDAAVLRSFNERMYNLLLAIEKRSGINLDIANLYFDVVEDYQAYRGKNEDSNLASGD